MIDRKLEPLIRRQMVKHLGELEDDDLIMFVVEHLKDHKGPQKLIEGLEPVRVTLFAHSSCIDLTFLERFWKKRHKSSPSAFGDKLFSRVWHTAKAYIRKSKWSIEQRGGLVRAGAALLRRAGAL